MKSCIRGCLLAFIAISSLITGFSAIGSGNIFQGLFMIGAGVVFLLLVRRTARSRVTLTSSDTSAIVSRRVFMPRDTRPELPFRL
jgi:hypothetical protein